MKDTVFTHNGGMDHVLLVDQRQKVISAWPVTDAVLVNYLASSEPSIREDWASHDLEEAISDYGLEVGRNGQLSLERQRFYRLIEGEV